VLVPTKELAEQVTQVFSQMTTYSGKLVKAINLTAGSDQVQRYIQIIISLTTRTQLSQSPEIIVSTPSRVLHHVTSSKLSLQSVQSLVIDEADLVLSYGHEADLQQISTLLPKTVQTYLMSATLTDEIHTLKTAMCRNPAILKLEEAERETDTLIQYYVECTEDDKFLLIYVILKLKLLKGKCIVFVNDVDRCYRVKLFLGQFGIRSCVLNAELPLNSRFFRLSGFE
jgi:ATP-dependent RNA helicase DDX56/DBP9